MKWKLPIRARPCTKASSTASIQSIRRTSWPSVPSVLRALASSTEARALNAEPKLWPRPPPIRLRKSIPAAWIELVLHEGRNRQVRRMTAAIAFPTLRLVRWAIDPVTLGPLAPGEWCDLRPRELPLLRRLTARPGDLR